MINRRTVLHTLGGALRATARRVIINNNANHRADAPFIIDLITDRRINYSARGSVTGEDSTIAARLTAFEKISTRNHAAKRIRRWGRSSDRTKETSTFVFIERSRNIASNSERTA